MSEYGQLDHDVSCRSFEKRVRRIKNSVGSTLSIERYRTPKRGLVLRRSSPVWNREDRAIYRYFSMLLARRVDVTLRMRAHYLRIFRIVVQLLHKGNPKGNRGVPSPPPLRTTPRDLCAERTPGTVCSMGLTLALEHLGRSSQAEARGVFNQHINML